MVVVNVGSRRRMHPIEPLLNKLNLRVAFFTIAGDGAPDGLRVSFELKQRTSVLRNG